MKYRVLVHYHFKKGMRDKGIKFIEENLLSKAKEMGCHDIEFLCDERDADHLIGTGLWNSLEEAKKFQSLWSTMEKKLEEMCTKAPQREIYSLAKSYEEKGRKAA